VKRHVPWRIRQGLDPFCLWVLDIVGTDGGAYHRYFATRAEARLARRVIRAAMRSA